MESFTCRDKWCRISMLMVEETYVSYGGDECVSWVGSNDSDSMRYAVQATSPFQGNVQFGRHSTEVSWREGNIEHHHNVDSHRREKLTICSQVDYLRWMIPVDCLVCRGVLAGRQYSIELSILTSDLIYIIYTIRKSIMIFHLNRSFEKRFQFNRIGTDG